MIYDLSDGYYVRGLVEADLEGPYTSWFEDQEVSKFNSHGKFTKNADWFRAFYENLNRQDKLVWAICNETDGHIGNISLQAISALNQNAEFAILLGNRKHWGKSVGLKAGLALISHGFYKLNLERIYCATAETNNGMRKLARKLSMIEEGRRRRHMFLEGEWVDVVEYGVLRKEFKGSIKK